MKAIVIFKFNNKIRLLLENGSIIKSDDANSLHPFLKQGDAGVMYDCPIKKKTRFKIQAEDAIFTMVYPCKSLIVWQEPANIIQPKKKRGRPKKNG